MSPDHSIQAKSHKLDDGHSPLLTAQTARAAYEAACNSVNLPAEEQKQAGFCVDIKEYSLVTGRMRALLGFISNPTVPGPPTPDRFYPVSKILADMEAVREELRSDQKCPKVRRVMWGRMVQAVTASLKESGYDVSAGSTRGV